MPINLPARRVSDAHTGLHDTLEEWGAVLAALCFAVALVGLISQTPPTYRAGLSTAVYEAMLQSP